MESSAVTYSDNHPKAKEWQRAPGILRATWMRTMVKDLASLNLGLHAAWQMAQTASPAGVAS